MQKNETTSEPSAYYERFCALQRTKTELKLRMKEEMTRHSVIESKKRTILDFLRVTYNLNHGNPRASRGDKEEVKKLIYIYSGMAQSTNIDTQDFGFEKWHRMIKMSRLEKNEILARNPIIFDGKNEIFAILNKGTLPMAYQKEFYDKYNIYPINYRIERVFRNYKVDHNDLLIYTCVIRNKNNKIVFEIYDNEQLLVSGNKLIWPSFCDFFTINISDLQLEDFFALSNSNVKMIIEKSANLNNYEYYIPLKERK